MKFPEARFDRKSWFDQKFSHEHMFADQIIWLALALCCVFLAATISMTIWFSRWIFRHGAATPTDLLFGGTEVILGLSLTWLFAKFTYYVSKQTWRKNIRGYVLWILTSPTGREWRIITPRGQRPQPNIDDLFAFGVPLGGWWHRGQVWEDGDQLVLRVVRKKGTNKVVVIDGYYRDRVTMPYDQDSSQMSFLRSNYDHTWFDILRRAQFDISELSVRNHLVKKLTKDVEAWQTASDDHFSDLIGTSRLIYSHEGKRVAQNWKTTLTVLMPKDMRDKYLAQPIPPRRVRRSTTEIV